MSKKASLLIKLILIFSITFTFLSPIKKSYAGGTGTCSVSPNYADAGSTNNTFYFTFTATNAMNSGELSINFQDAMNNGFSPPQITNSTNEGYISLDSKSSDVILARVLNPMDTYLNWIVSNSTHISLGFGDHCLPSANDCLNVTIKTSAVANDKWYTTTLSSEDWSKYTAIGFWIKSDNDIPSGTISFAFSKKTDLSGTTADLKEYDIGSIPSDTWIYKTIGIAGINNVRSYGFIYKKDNLSSDTIIEIDDILIGPSGLTIYGGNEVRARFLTMENGGWIKIKYQKVKVSNNFGWNDFITKTRNDTCDTFGDISSYPIITIYPTTTTNLTIFPPSFDLSAGNFVGIVIKRLYSEFPVTKGNLEVTLETNSPKGKFMLSPGGSAIPKVTIPDGQSYISLYYYDESAGDWTIKAKAGGGIIDGEAHVTVDPLPCSKFIITLPGQTFTNGVGNSGTPQNIASGESFQITVRAVDKYNNIDIYYIVTEPLTFSGPSCITCNSTTYKPEYNGNSVDCNTTAVTFDVTFSNGVSSPISVKLYKAETTSIHVTDGIYIGDSSTFSVISLLKEFKLTFPDTSTKIAGQSFPLIIEAIGEYCNPIKFTGTVDLFLVKAGGDPILPPPSTLIYPSSVTFSNETSKTVQVKIYKSYNDAYIKAQNHDGVQIGYSGPIDIWHSDLHHFRFDEIAPYVSQGSGFTVTIYAEDEWGNLIDNIAGATPYKGTVTLTCSLGIDKITPTTVSFNDGASYDGKVTPAVTITSPGTAVTITATDTTLNKTGTSNPFPVYGTIDHYEFATIGPQVKNVQFSIKLSVKDMVGNTLLNNNELVSLSAETNDGTSIVLSVSGGNPIQLVNGVWEGNISLNSPNPQVRVRATRTAAPWQFGVSNWFTVADNAPTKFIFDTISSPKIAGTPFSITIRAVDYYNSPVTNYNGTATLSASTGAGTISPTSITFINGEWSGNVTLTTPNPSVVLTCYDSTTSAMGTSNAFQVTGGVESFRFSTISSPQYKNENICLNSSS